MIKPGKADGVEWETRETLVSTFFLDTDTSCLNSGKCYPALRVTVSEKDFKKVI